MTRVPVQVKRGWVPPNAAAWVPRPRTIVVKRGARITTRLVAHELKHALQFEELGWFFYLAYAWAALMSGFDHSKNHMENEARKAELDPKMVRWAEDVIERKGL